MTNGGMILSFRASRVASGGAAGGVEGVAVDAADGDGGAGSAAVPGTGAGTAGEEAALCADAPVDDGADSDVTGAATTGSCAGEVECRVGTAGEPS